LLHSNFREFVSYIWENTYQILMKILPETEMYLWTSKSMLNFKSHPNQLWQRSVLCVLPIECSCLHRLLLCKPLGTATLVCYVNNLSSKHSFIHSFIQAGQPTNLIIMQQSQRRVLFIALLCLLLGLHAVAWPQKLYMYDVGRKT